MAIDDSQSERLWRQIEARKQAEGSAPIPDDPAKNGNAPGEVAFVDALFKTLQEECALPSPDDQDAARARLREAITSDRTHVPLSVPIRAPKPPRRFEWNRLTLLIALLLLLTVVGASFAAWNAWQRMCHTTKAHKSTLVTPSADSVRTIVRGGENLSRIGMAKTTDAGAAASKVDERTQIHCE